MSGRGGQPRRLRRERARVKASKRARDAQDTAGRLWRDLEAYRRRTGATDGR